MIYLDSCAVAKLVLIEPESAALAEYLDRTTGSLVSSELTEVELHRALIKNEAGQEAHHRADDLLTDITMLPLSPVIATAARLPGKALRSLDALHLATAQRLRKALTGFITYDKRLAEAVRAVNMPVNAPGQIL